MCCIEKKRVYFLRLPVSILSAGPQGFSPFPLPNTRSGSLYPQLPPTPSTFPHKSLPPSPLVIAFFFLPSGTEASSLGHFSMLSLLNSQPQEIGGWGTPPPECTRDLGGERFPVLIWRTFDEMPDSRERELIEPTSSRKKGIK